MANPFDKDLHREAIDSHKQRMLADPWKLAARSNYTQETCILYWIEQQGDAELYLERWQELEDEKATDEQEGN